MAIAGIAILVAFAVFLLVASVLYEAWVLQHLWSWFIEPSVHFAPSFPQAIGFVLIAGLLLAGASPTPDAEDPWALPKRIFNVSLLYPTAVLGLGWLIQHWM